MKLRHTLHLDIDPGKDLAALAIVCVTAVTLTLGAIWLSAGRHDQPGLPQVPLDVSTRHRLDQPQQRGIESGADRQDRLRALTGADGHD